MDDQKVEIINRQASFTLKLSEIAKDFGFDLEPDSHEDVWHNGYSSRDIRGKINLPEDLEGADLIFPNAVAVALEEALLKIDLLGGGAEYQDQDGDMISTKAGITQVDINEANDEIVIHITNPEHLLNTILTGVGYFGPELNAKEVESDKEITSRIHHLKEYFEVYGETIPSGELSSQYSPSINDEYFAEEIKFRISELSVDEIADAVKELTLETDTEPKEAIELAAKISGKSGTEILQALLNKVDEEKAVWAAIKI